MAEIVELRPGELAPMQGEYLLVRRINEKFVAILAEVDRVSIMPPSPFETREGAFIAASRLADIMQVPLIYIEISN